MAASIRAQTAEADKTAVTACLHVTPGLNATDTILLQIKLMVSTAEIASRMS